MLELYTSSSSVLLSSPLVSSIVCTPIVLPSHTHTHHSPPGAQTRGKLWVLDGRIYNYAKPGAQEVGGQQEANQVLQAGVEASKVGVCVKRGMKEMGQCTGTLCCLTTVEMPHYTLHINETYCSNIIHTHLHRRSLVLDLAATSHGQHRFGRSRRRSSSH